MRNNILRGSLVALCAIAGIGLASATAMNIGMVSSERTPSSINPDHKYGATSTNSLLDNAMTAAGLKRNGMGFGPMKAFLRTDEDATKLRIFDAKNDLATQGTLLSSATLVNILGMTSSRHDHSSDTVAGDGRQFGADMAGRLHVVITGCERPDSDA